MGLLNCNDLSVISGTIRLPRLGVWNADLVVDSADSITGPVELSTAYGAFSLQGTAYRSGSYQQTVSVRVLGGAGGLSTPPGGIGSVLTPKFYQGATVRLVLGDILAACGETLSTTSDTTTLATVLKRWVVMGGSGKDALARLFEPYDVVWRVLSDGKLWVGAEKWSPAPTTQFDVMTRKHEEGRAVIASEAPWLLPGVTLTMPAGAGGGTEQVSYVAWTIESTKIRADVWFERAA